MSVEVLRLLPLLEARGVDFVVYNAVSGSHEGRRVVPVAGRRWLWVLRYFLTGREPAIYLMSDRLASWTLGAVAAALRGKRVIVQLRNSFLADWIAESPWRRVWAGWALRRMTRVVCVSRFLEEAARTVGVDPHRIFYKPAFIPPGLTDQERAGVHPDAWAFITGRRPLIAANGKVLWHQGEDLYGLDHLVELAARLRPDYPALGIIVCFWDHLPAEDDYLETLRRRAAELGVADHILFHTRYGPFVPILVAADLLVRPTNTDGDAVSVREALCLGVPVVASDAAERPLGTILHRTRDLDDFVVKVRSVLDGPDRQTSRRPVVDEDERSRLAAYVEMLAAVAAGSDGVTESVTAATQGERP